MPFLDKSVILLETTEIPSSKSYCDNGRSEKQALEAVISRINGDDEGHHVKHSTELVNTSRSPIESGNICRL